MRIVTVMCVLMVGLLLFGCSSANVVPINSEKVSDIIQDVSGPIQEANGNFVVTAGGINETQ